MRILFDLLYLILLLLLSPWILWRAWRTGRYRRHLAAKLLGHVEFARSKQPTVWFHGVSVGEIHLLDVVIKQFQSKQPGYRVVVSSTTDTGLTEAKTRFGDAAIPYPFDFSWACDNALSAVKPVLIVLAESDLWPNFLATAKARGVPVVVINGRISARSFSRMLKFKSVVWRFLLKPVARFAVQSEEYAERYRILGVKAERITVTGSVKYDGAGVPASGDELRKLLGYTPAHRVWVAGSTHAPEEEIVLRVFAKLKARVPNLHLILVPRHKDRFDDVAKLIEASGMAYVRRSQLRTAWQAPPPVLLLDTMGELGSAWALADVGFTGGSFDGVRQGQSMIEPAGYGVPNVFGPFVSNFADAAARLIEAKAAAQVHTEGELEDVLRLWLLDDDLRQSVGTNAARLVKQQQGATARTIKLLAATLAQTEPPN